MHGQRGGSRGRDRGRSRGDARGRVGVVTALFLAVSLVGAATTLGSGYLVIRGPFLGGATLDPVPLFAALGGFVVGIVVTTWAAVRAADVGARL